MPIFKSKSSKHGEHELIIGCDCGSIEHQAQIWYDEDDKDFVCFTVILVSWKSFFKRLLHGLKYAFGYKSRYGAFDEILLYRDDVKELIEYLKGFLNASKNQKGN